jgi:hypothetical protein
MKRHHDPRRALILKLRRRVTGQRAGGAGAPAWFRRSGSSLRGPQSVPPPPKRQDPSKVKIFASCGANVGGDVSLVEV